MASLSAGSSSERLPPNASPGLALPVASGSGGSMSSSPRPIPPSNAAGYSGITARMRTSAVTPGSGSSFVGAGIGGHRRSATSPVGPEGDTFMQSLSITLDEPVGSMSMSPSNRDVVLGARKGLFIVDLENPFDQPRFLPHSATWDVADVQWSIHPARSSWVVSTSSQKALVWNLDLPYTSTPAGSSAGLSPGDLKHMPYASVQSPIEYVLDAHTRAICDINWSVFNPDVLATCGMDSCIMAWDLRSRGGAPSQTFCAWGSPATQVKWNRQDSHLIASSHDSRVLVWDARKAAVPIIEIKAHSEKIYGIDWSRRSANHLITCSLDKTVKFWSTLQPNDPSLTITTSSPVWRARHLPFGHGVLTLPQRSDTSLQLWSKDRPEESVATFSGHADTVREFVWRVRGGSDATCDDRQFQLVTWGKDCKLRLWPVSDDVLRSVGHRPGAPIDVRVTRTGASNRTYRQSSLSVPAAPSPPSSMSPVTSRGGMMGSASSAKTPAQDQRLSWERRFGARPPRDLRSRTFRRPGVMTRATTTFARPNAEDRLAWMEGVKLFKKGDTGQDAPQVTVGKPRETRSLSRLSSAAAVESSEAEPPQNLGEELRSAARTFSRVVFETIAVQARTCSVGLYGPWAAKRGVAFLRATFTFPKAYPARKPPTIEIERSADVTARTRAGLLKAAREIMLKHAAEGSPSFEACLQFLLGEKAESGKKVGAAGIEGSSDSEDEEEIPSRIDPAILRNNVNVPLPARGGACFGPQGQLVTFFSADSRSAIADRRPSTTSVQTEHTKFEAFGTIGSAHTHFEEDCDTSESDEELRRPKGHERTSAAAVPSAEVTAPAIRRISTLLSIRTLPDIQPWSAAEHFESDLDQLASTMAQIAQERDNAALARVWTSFGHLLATSMPTAFSGDSSRQALSFQQVDLLQASLGYLGAQHDLEALGLVAAELEELRRRMPRSPKQETRDTDYFSAMPILKGAGFSPRGFAITPLATEGSHHADLASSFSPTKGSWGSSIGALFSTSVFSLRGASSPDEPLVARSNPRPRLDSIDPSRLSEILPALPTPTHEVAAAALRQMAQRRPGFDTRASSLSVDSGARTIDATAKRPRHGTAGKRKSKVVRIRLSGGEVENPSAFVFKGSVNSQLELHRHSLAELFLRRGDPLGRATVVQMLQANHDPDSVDTRGRYVSRQASGLDSGTRVELGMLCDRCGGRLQPDSRRCFRCARAGASALCVICGLKVEGMSHNCGICLHGGHPSCIESWFGAADTCPAGCDCSCLGDGGLAGLFNTVGFEDRTQEYRTAQDNASQRSLSTVRTSKRRNGVGHRR